jgi:hypothetical protein
VTGWTPVTVATVSAAMPTDFEVAYMAWIVANPTKSTRLANIVAMVVRMFRTAVKAQVGYDPDTDPTTVPDAALLHAQNLVLFELGMEMGVALEPQVYNLYTQANVWLRMVARGALKIDVGDVGVGTPSYARNLKDET